MQTIVSIPGMHSERCRTLIQDVSADFPEIQSVEVDLVSKQVSLRHSKDFLQEHWIAAIEELGFPYKVEPVF